MLWAGHDLIEVTAGCDLGAWCVGGRYRVDAPFADRATLELLHEQLRIVPA